MSREILGSMDVATHDPTQSTEAEKEWAIAKFQEWADEITETLRCTIRPVPRSILGLWETVNVDGSRMTMWTTREQAQAHADRANAQLDILWELKSTPVMLGAPWRKSASGLGRCQTTDFFRCRIHGGHTRSQFCIRWIACVPCRCQGPGASEHCHCEDCTREHYENILTEATS